MRLYLLSAAALMALAVPAMAQDRTLPAGTSFEAQPPIDWTMRPAEGIVPISPRYEGRSVDVAPAPHGMARRVHQQED